MRINAKREKEKRLFDCVERENERRLKGTPSEMECTDPIETHNYAQTLEHKQKKGTSLSKEKSIHEMSSGMASCTHYQSTE